MMWNPEVDPEDEPLVVPMQRRVVLVEDDIPLREILADEIRDLGFDVVELTNGVELLDHFRGAASSYAAELPEIVIAEMELAGCSGVEACERLHSAGAHVPFILILPEGLAQNHADALRAGADRVLEKPFDVDALADAVESVARN